MLRRAYLALCSISLLLLIAALALLIYFGRARTGVAVYPHAHAQYVIFAGEQNLVLGRSTFSWSVARDVVVMRPNLWMNMADDVGDEINARRRVQLWNVGELAIRRLERTYPQHHLREWRVYLPYWFLCILFSILPLHGAITVRRERRRRRRLAANCCPACGYDLRATPEICPECGATLDAPPRAPSPASPTPGSA